MIDPVTMKHLGRIRQQEILEFAAKNQRSQSIRGLMQQLGVLFIAIGQKMITVADPFLTEPSTTSPRP